MEACFGVSTRGVDWASGASSTQWVILEGAGLECTKGSGTVVDESVVIVAVGMVGSGMLLVTKWEGVMEVIVSKGIETLLFEGWETRGPGGIHTGTVVWQLGRGIVQTEVTTGASVELGKNEDIGGMGTLEKPVDCDNGGTTDWSVCIVGGHGEPLLGGTNDDSPESWGEREAGEKDTPPGGISPAVLINSDEVGAAVGGGK